MADLTDVELIDALVRCDRLSERQETAFKGMRMQLCMRERPLSPAQRDWAQLAYHELDLDAEEPCANLVSSGAVRVSAAELQLKYNFELMPRPLRPPGR